MTGRQWRWALCLVVTVASVVGLSQWAAGQETTFLVAHKEVLATMEELRVLLEGVKDAKTADAAAKELPGITDRFVTQSKAATLLYVSLSADAKQNALKVMQEEQIEKIKAGKLNPKNDLLSLMVQLSKGPQRPSLEKALMQLRDTLLDQKSIYVPVTARESIAKKLGAKGSPLSQ